MQVSKFFEIKLTDREDSCMIIKAVEEGEYVITMEDDSTFYFDQDDAEDIIKTIKTVIGNAS
tara:strand:+ start:79 stop:264 length:186 start_codon:yes stop_codon:yes gene_type:complete